MLEILLYSTVFSLAYSGVLVWILERREKTYRQGRFSFTDAFVAGSIILILVYFLNIVVLLRWPRAAFPLNVLMVTALAAFCLYKETGYRLTARRVRRRQKAEVRLLEIYARRDPGNAALFERMSELHEKLGDKAQATETARLAAKLDPTVKNHWRVKQLEED